jgi:hypothetical protein
MHDAGARSAEDGGSLLAKAGDNCSNAEHQLAVIQSLFPEVSE